jgi:hypothetical protein
MAEKYLTAEEKAPYLKRLLDLMLTIQDHITLLQSAHNDIDEMGQIIDSNVVTFEAIEAGVAILEKGVKICLVPEITEEQAETLLKEITP